MNAKCCYRRTVYLSYILMAGHVIARATWRVFFELWFSVQNPAFASQIFQRKVSDSEPLDNLWIKGLHEQEMRRPLNILKRSRNWMRLMNPTATWTVTRLAPAPTTHHHPLSPVRCPQTIPVRCYLFVSIFIAFEKHFEQKIDCILVKRLNELSVKINEHGEKITCLEIDVENMQKEVTSLQEENSSLRIAVDDLENRTRRQNLVFHRIPEGGRRGGLQADCRHHPAKVCWSVTVSIYNGQSASYSYHYAAEVPG